MERSVLDLLEAIELDALEVQKLIKKRIDPIRDTFDSIDQVVTPEENTAFDDAIGSVSNMHEMWDGRPLRVN